MLKIAIVTSCTGEKQHKPNNQLTQNDFCDSDVLETRTNELSNYILPACDMYTGDQHLRLMQGISEFKAHNHKVELYIVSAGYGLLHETQHIAPYECTFSTMTAKQINEWSTTLQIPQQCAKVFSQNSFDLVIVLLGDKYLRALQLSNSTEFNSPTIFLCANKSKELIKGQGKIFTVPLAATEAKQFHCGLVGLKGEVAKLLLMRMRTARAIPNEVFSNFLGYLDHDYNPNELPLPSVTKERHAPNVITQVENTHPTRLQYFLPDWQDTVNPDYDFTNDNNGNTSHNKQIQQHYGHEILGNSYFDGLLVSKSVTRYKRSQTIRQSVRLHNSLPIMGDTGAFSYSKLYNPPFTTNDLINHYQTQGFDLGVSLDHICFGAESQQEKLRRYNLTIHNAYEFFMEHSQLKLHWTPIASIQGWDITSYKNAAQHVYKMGYTYIAIGGIAYQSDKYIVQVLQAIRDALPKHVRLHVFGVARASIIKDYHFLSVTSADSASPVRQAIMCLQNSYWTDDKKYTTIPIPPSTVIVNKKNSTLSSQNIAKIMLLENQALQNLSSFDKGEITTNQLHESILAYNYAIGKSIDTVENKYLQTLEEKIWKKCSCNVCKNIGIHVVVFRGRNRNQRRGFHNTFTLYQKINQIIESCKTSADVQICDYIQLPMFAE